MLFVVTGIDGSGKSSALARLSLARPQWAVGSYEPADWIEGSEDPEVERFRGDHPRNQAVRLAPSEQDEFFAGLLEAHRRTWLEPRLREEGPVVLDSYHFRFLAKQRLRGAPTVQMERVIADLPPPDTVFVLDVDPERAARRKRSFDAFEHFGEPDLPGFLHFQRLLDRELMRLCLLGCDEVVRLATSGSTDDTSERLADEIEVRLQGI